MFFGVYLRRPFALTPEMTGVTLRSVLLSLIFAVAAFAAEPPAPVLVAFEQRVVSTLASHERDSPDALRTLKAGLRRELQTVAPGVAMTPPNAELQARILVRLEDRASAARLAGASLSEGRRLFERQDYTGALAYANAVLVVDPANGAALALKKMSEGRSTGTLPPTSPSGQTAPPITTASSRDAIVFTPRSKRPKTEVPRIPHALQSAQYVSAGDKPRKDSSPFVDALINMKNYHLHRMTPEEAARLDAVKKTLELSPSAQAHIRKLGGWEEIHKLVDVMFAPIVNPNTLAYTRRDLNPLSPKKVVLVINSRLLAGPDEFIATTLAHELGHADDLLQRRFDGGFLIPSEFGAHRLQVYTALELLRSIPPARQAELDASPDWRYQNFVVDLWQDRILERFPTRKSFIDRHRGLQDEASDAYRDLRNKAVRPGSPQLDHHINGPETGMYRVNTTEKDILDIVAARRATPGYTEEQRRIDENLLGRREQMLGEFDMRDSDFRQMNGYVIDED